MERASHFSELGRTGLILIVFALSACNGSADTRKQTILETTTGKATYYARLFEGKTTASGHPFTNHARGAAHRTYPFGTVIRVTNLRNGRSTNVVIIDRGPYGKNYRDGVILDVSRSAARHLGFMREGEIEVRLDVLAWGDGARVNDTD